MATKFTLKVAAVYNPEKQEGITKTLAHYVAQALLPDGKAISSAPDSSWRQAIDALAEEASLVLGLRSCEVDWIWNTDGGGTGRVNFPVLEEALIIAALRKEAEAEQRRLDSHNALVAVAQAIQDEAALPEGYSWKLVTPYDAGSRVSQWERGERVWLYAIREGAGDTPCLAIYRKNVGGYGYLGRGGHHEIWIEGPGYRPEAKKCKANSKGNWVAKAATFIPEYLEGRKVEEARKVAAAKYGEERKAREQSFCRAAGIPSTSLRFGEYGELGSLAINGVSEFGRIDLSVTSLRVNREDAVAIIGLIREAAARQVAADKAERDARVASLKAQG